MFDVELGLCTEVEASITLLALASSSSHGGKTVGIATGDRIMS